MRAIFSLFDELLTGAVARRFGAGFRFCVAGSRLARRVGSERLGVSGREFVSSEEGTVTITAPLLNWASVG